MDQVPRYFERQVNTTITLRGSQSVKLLKASTSHKRFTYTATINAAGDILDQDVLFSDLVNVPRNVEPNVHCQVNKTGMWSFEITKRWFDRVIFSDSACSAFSREHTLLIIDSFSAHVILIETDELFKSKLVRHRVHGDLMLLF